MSAAEPRRATPRGTRGSRLQRFLSEDIWRSEWRDATAPVALGIHLLRLFSIAGRGFVEHRQGIRAAALTYYSVLSMVPTLAFAFALAKGFGAYERLESEVLRPFIERTFGGGEAVEPAGVTDLRDAIEQVLHLVTETDVSRLGGVGLAVMLFTVVKLLSHVEAALNSTFGVRRARSLVRKFADYTAMATIVPVLALAATAVGAAGGSEWLTDLVRNRLELGALLDVLIGVAPFSILTVVFALLITVLPNTRVRLRSALIGGAVSALLWVVIQRVYVGAQVGVASYNALYAGFAAIPLFLVWTWLSWMVVLSGAEFAHADQNHRAYGAMRLARPGSQVELERTGLRILLRLAARFREGGLPWSLGGLMLELEEPQERLSQALELLRAGGLVASVELDEDEGWLPTAAPSTLRIETVRRAMRGPGVDQEQWSGVDGVLLEQLGLLDGELEALPHNLTLDELLRRAGAGSGE